jgi:16S rRNA (guanine1516-N2)-methyltransferase
VTDLIDFTDATSLSSLVYRLKHGGGHRKQAIARAVGTSSKYRLTVIDATCGFGSDAMVLANLNCQVYAIEQNPEIARLLKDRLLLAQQHPILQPIIKDIKLFTGNSIEVIPQLIHQYGFIPDVIYLDPMFNGKSKAAPNKLIQKLRKIITEQPADLTDNNDYLLEVSLQHCKKRVVVKRAKHAPYLADLKPSYSLTGKANRFDVYLPQLCRKS